MKTTIGILSLLLLIVFAGPVNAQNGKRNSCTNGISNLTEEQKSSITALETSYQKQMADYRAERQASTDVDTKNAIRTKMLEARSAHQNEVKALLDDNQKSEFDSWVAGQRGNQKLAANNRAGKRGNNQLAGRGNGQGQAKGKGSCGNGPCMRTN